MAVQNLVAQIVQQQVTASLASPTIQGSPTCVTLTLKRPRIQFLTFGSSPTAPLGQSGHPGQVGYLGHSGRPDGSGHTGQSDHSC